MAGILFCFCKITTAAAPFPLYEQLYREGDWPGARREALRVAATDPRAEVRAAAAKLRMDPRDPAAAERLKQWSESDDAGAAATAALERGQCFIRERNFDEAWDSISKAFLKTGDPSEFITAGTALTALALQDRSRLREDPAVVRQLAIAQELWTRQAVRDALPRSLSWPRALIRFPARAVIAVYRHAIAPGIGARCSLHPSCSAYFTECSRRHGLMAWPMFGDRMIREPKMNSEGKPVAAGDRVRRADPVSDHDFWMKP